MLRSLASAAVVGLALVAGSLHPVEGARAGLRVYVAPDGDDGADGTRTRPFGTLPRAQEAARAVLAQGSGEDVTVVLGGGRYELAAPLVFDGRDSGSETCRVTYRSAHGETALITGGRRVEGWRRGTGGVWTARIPEVADGSWYPTQLFVDGRRATRARTPNAGPGGARSGFELQGAELADDRSRYELRVPPEALQDLGSPPAAEVNVYGSYETFRKRIAHADPQTGLLSLAGPHVAPLAWLQPRAGSLAYIENAPGLLDEPGEWYLDPATGVLAYLPLPGERMAAVEAILPRLTRLMEVRGSPKCPVRNLHFEGIAFEHTAWHPPEWGYLGRQAATYLLTEFAEPALREGLLHDLAEPLEEKFALVDAGLRWEFAHSCSLTTGRLSHMGGSGLWLGRGCRDCLVEGTVVRDVGANGLIVGEEWSRRYMREDLPPPNEVPTGNRVANNDVARCGAVLPGAVGIWVAFAAATAVCHNEVHDLPYTGISVGFMWNTQETCCRENVIEHNHVHDVMQTMYDGGGIYTTGRQPGTVIRANWVHDVRQGPLVPPGDNGGLYLDEGSAGYYVAENVVRNVTGSPLLLNRNGPEAHTWGENSFGAGPSDGQEPAASRMVSADSGFGRPARRTAAAPEWVDEVKAAAGVEAKWRARLRAHRGPPDPGS